MENKTEQEGNTEIKVLPRRVKDIMGQVFGRLIVIGFVGVDKHKKARWSCLCECGAQKVLSSEHLLSGKTLSCGCLRNDITSSHKMSKHKGYIAWISIKRRVLNQNIPNWNNYGGRGIKMCQEWQDSFEAFWEDMGGTWQEGLTLDRTDVDGNYCKENCRWTTNSVQGHNKRKKEGCSSQYKGVYKYFNADNTIRYVVYIKINRKPTYIGTFHNEMLAAKAYDDLAENMYGDRPNGTTKLVERNC